MFRLAFLLLALPALVLGYRPVYPGINEAYGYEGNLGLSNIDAGNMVLATSVPVDSDQIRLAVDSFEQSVPMMGWSSGAPTAIPLGGSAWNELQMENQKLLNKDLATLLSHAKTSVQAPIHTRTQPIIRAVPKFQQPVALPIMRAPVRVEQMKQHQNRMITQSPIVTSSPLLNSKSALAQAMLGRGLRSSIGELEDFPKRQQVFLQHAGEEFEPEEKLFFQGHEQQFVQNPKFSYAGYEQYEPEQQYHQRFARY